MVLSYSESHFVTIHSNYQKTHHKYLLAESNLNLNSLSLRFDDAQLEEYYFVECVSGLPEFPVRYRVAADGLICIASKYYHQDSTICIYNPAIRKVKTLPDPPRMIRTAYDRHVVRLAFGFCPEANDFKVVRLVYGKYDDKFTLADVYSLTTNSWNKIDNDNGITMDYVGMSDWVFLNDTAFFRGDTMNKENIILCCDTYKNIMREISLPESCALDYLNIHSSIRLYGNTIALFVKKSSTNCSGFNMWILKDEVSWEKKMSFILPTMDEEWNWNVIGMRNNGEVILYDFWGEKLMSYNVDKDEAKYLVGWHQCSSSDLGWCPPAIRVYPFSESLVLIDT